MTIPPKTSLPSTATLIDFDSFVDLFYEEQSSERGLGRFEKCSAEAMPAHAQRLLAHEHHMTVTVEQHFRSEVDLKVLTSHRSDDLYWRKIVLTLRNTGRVAMFGLVRIDLKILEDPVRTAIWEQQIPLGRILIDHDVLRKVRLVDLYRIDPGEDLQACWPRHSSETKTAVNRSKMGHLSASGGSGCSGCSTGDSTAINPSLKNATGNVTGNTAASGGEAADRGHCCYGRTALIYCDHRPVIELLEIVDGQIGS